MSSGDEDAGHRDEARDALDAVRPATDRGVGHARDPALLGERDVGEAGDVGDGGMIGSTEPVAALLLPEPEVLVQHPEEIVRPGARPLRVELEEEPVMEPRGGGGRGDAVREGEPLRDFAEGPRVTGRIPLTALVVLRGEVDEDRLRVAES